MKRPRKHTEPPEPRPREALELQAQTLIDELQVVIAQMTELLRSAHG